MRRADSPCRISTVLVLVLATVLGLFASILLLAAWPASYASAVAASLTLSADRILSLEGQPVMLTVSGKVSGSLEGARLVIVALGPVQAAQVGRAGLDPAEAARVVYLLSERPAVAPVGETGAPSGEPPVQPSTMPARAELGSEADLAAGVLQAAGVLPAGTPAEPGAYLLEVQVQVQGEVVAVGQVWVGKVADRDTPLDVAVVLPVSLGIHRDATGTFFDQVLERAVGAISSDAGALRGLIEAFDRFPGWGFTLALEPILLTQLRDMADGYAGVDAAGGRVEVGADDPAAIAAEAALFDLKALAGQTRVETAVSPYSGADLGLIAAQGWRDGLEQILMGKQELQQTLGLGSPLIGAVSPDLELTSDALAYYAQASIDHVVVGEALIGRLAETVDAGAVAVRARDIENDRVTLIFSSGTMSAAMAEPWDGDLFGAALAAELATTPRDAIVLTPGTTFAVPPGEYLESIAATLTSTDWIRTQTLIELIRAHSPGTRPILLQTESHEAQGYIEESLLSALQAAHAAVTDLAGAADATRTPVDTAHRLLAIAESRWWSRTGIDPTEASIGLEYAAQAQAVAQGELDHVRIVGVGSTFFTGDKGIVELSVENAAGYPLAVDLQLSGTGVEFPDGDSVKVQLQSGTTELAVKVVRADGGPHSFGARLVAGTTVLDELTQSMRFLGLTAILPWLIVAVVVIAAGTYLIVRRIVRRRSRAGGRIG